MKKYCKCCEKEIEMAFGGTRYCKKCSLYIFELKKENNSLKLRIKRKDERIKQLESKILLKNEI